MPIALDQDFPHAYSHTDRLRRGLPRTFAVTDEHVTFLRSSGPRDAQLSLWRFAVASAAEELLVAAEDLQADDAELPEAERARRERLRESGAGITGYSQDRFGDRIVFAVGGGLWCWDRLGVRAVETQGPVFDPRIDPTGELVACVIDGGLHVLRFVDGDEVLRVARAGLTVGSADFAAAEELSRYTGHWWAPDGSALIVEVVDEAPVPLWRIADPTHPEREPREHRYPHAGANNASCSLLLVDVASGVEREIPWDHTQFEYLVSVRWTREGAPLVTLANRGQTRFETFRLDLATATLTSVVVSSGEPWVEVSIGAPAWLPDGRLVHVIEDRDADTRRLAIDGEPVTVPDFQVSSIISVGEAGIVVAGAADARTLSALHIAQDGMQTALGYGFSYSQFASNGNVHVRTMLTATSSARRVEVMRGGNVIGRIAVHAEQVRMPAPQFELLDDLHAVVLWPEQQFEGRLPVVLSPYGGPHHAKVIAAAGSFAEDQWLANQGFCVIVADGRGTPGRGLAWEHAIADAFAEITLEDQVRALRAALALFPDRLDASRVGIRGWSYGGYLSALALLARPDVFHVGIAGAPVTDWTLYDTAYTERYLGDPRKFPEVYARNSLAPLAPNLRGNLLIVHGLADDNVVAAHSLQLSAALLAAGRLHEFLPLAGVSHMTPQATVTENLMRLQAEYFQRHLRPAALRTDDSPRQPNAHA